MTISPSDLTNLYNEFAQRTAKEQHLLPETVQAVTKALHCSENTPETLSVAYQSLSQPHVFSDDASEKIIDMFCTALRNPKNNKDSLECAANCVSHLEHGQTQNSIDKYARALDSYIYQSSNPSEALSNTYDFFYNISQADVMVCTRAHEKVADFLKSSKNDDKSVRHVIERHAQFNKNLPEDSMSLKQSLAFFAVIDSSLNQTNYPIYSISKAIMSTLPKLRRVSQTKAQIKLNDIFEKANTSQTYLFIQAMESSKLAETYPDLCLNLIQSKLKQENISDDSLGAMSSQIKKSTTANPELIEQASDTYAQILKHPSCNTEILDDVYLNLSEIIKKHPNKAAKPFSTYQTAMQHPQNDDTSTNTAQECLSDIITLYPHLAQTAKINGIIAEPITPEKSKKLSDNVKRKIILSRQFEH